MSNLIPALHFKFAAESLTQMLSRGSEQAAAPVAAAAAEAAPSRAVAAKSLLKSHGLPLAAGIVAGVAGKRLYDNVTYAEDHRAQGIRV